MKPKHTKNDPWARLDAMFAATKEPTGPEWFTIAELRERYGWTPHQAKNKIAKLRMAGDLETWKGCVAGKCGNVTKYRLTNNAP